VPLEALIDPEKPVGPAELVDLFVPVEKLRCLIGRFAWLEMRVLAIADFAAAWHWALLGRCPQPEGALTSGLAYKVLPLAQLQQVPIGDSTAPDALAILQRMTGLQAVADPTLDTPARRYGNAVLMRFPVCAVRTLDLSFRSREPRARWMTDIDFGAETWRVVATNPGLASCERRVQVDQLLQRFDTPAMPVILPGDLYERFIYGQTRRRLTSHFYRARFHEPLQHACPSFALDRV
jgi:hypothetical protein